MSGASWARVRLVLWRDIRATIDPTNNPGQGLNHDWLDLRSIGWQSPLWPLSCRSAWTPCSTAWMSSCQYWSYQECGKSPPLAAKAYAKSEPGDSLCSDSYTHTSNSMFPATLTHFSNRPLSSGIFQVHDSEKSSPSSQGLSCQEWARGGSQDASRLTG